MTKPTRKKLATPFGRNLQKLLAERNLSQRDAAALASVGSAVVNEWINGAVPHDLQAVSKLCVALKCDFQWLLTGEHAAIDVKQMALSELFEIENDPAFSGLFMIEAKRLKRKPGGEK